MAERDAGAKRTQDRGHRILTPAQIARQPQDSRRLVAFPADLVTFNVDIRERKNVANIGLNLRFGSGPVVARY